MALPTCVAQLKVVIVIKRKTDEADFCCHHVNSALENAVQQVFFPFISLPIYILKQPFLHAVNWYEQINKTMDLNSKVIQ